MVAGDPRAFFFAALNIFLSPLLLLSSPLVLSFADLSTVGRVAFGGGFGVLLGGLAMTMWGGPRRRRMRGLLLGTLLSRPGLLAQHHRRLVDTAARLIGTPIGGTRVAARLRARVGLDVPLRVIFRATTVRALAAAVEDWLHAEIEAMDEGDARRLAEKG